MNFNKIEIENVIQKFILDELDVENKNFTTKSNLFEDGYIDSVRLEKVFGFIEEYFVIMLDEDHFFDDRISSISGMSEIIMEIKENMNEEVIR